MQRRKLRFKKKFIPHVISGEKRTTIRLKKKYEIGDIVDILDEEENLVCKAVIVDIKSKYFSTLTNEDALLDGFKDLNELKNTLKKIYRNIEGKRLFIYFFKPL